MVSAVAELAESTQSNPSIRWKCTRSLQEFDSGRKLILTSLVHNKEGHLVSSTDADGLDMDGRWFQHFNSVLNI